MCWETLINQPIQCARWVCRWQCIYRWFIYSSAWEILNASMCVCMCVYLSWELIYWQPISNRPVNTLLVRKTVVVHTSAAFTQTQTAPVESEVCFTQKVHVSQCYLNWNKHLNLQIFQNDEWLSFYIMSGSPTAPPCGWK